MDAKSDKETSRGDKGSEMSENTLEKLQKLYKAKLRGVQIVDRDMQMESVSNRNIRGY